MDAQDIRNRYQQLLGDYHANRIDWKAFERGLFELKKMRASSANLSDEPETIPAGRHTDPNTPVSYRPRRESPFPAPTHPGRFTPPAQPKEQELLYPIAQAAENNTQNAPRPVRSSGSLVPQRRNRQLNAGVRLAENYRLQRQLGIGLCGETWRALEIETSNFVTLKTLPLPIQEDPGAVSAFLYAVQRVSKLRFPGIAPVYKSEWDDVLGQFLVSAYLDAMPLNLYREQYQRTFREFPMAAVIRVLWAVAKSLDFAHQKGITHRGLKPDNVLVGRQCGVMTTDFCFPQAVQAELLRLGQNPEGFETERYTAPEVWLRQAFSPKSDQFSLAVLAVQLISGSLPFPGNNEEELRESILSKEPVLPKGLSARSEKALRKALSKESEERFNGCLDFVAELAEFDVPAAQAGNARLKKEGLWAVFGPTLLPEPDYVAHATFADIFPFSDWKSAPDPQDGIKPDKASYPYVSQPSTVPQKQGHLMKNLGIGLTLAAVLAAAVSAVGLAVWGLPMLKERLTASQASPSQTVSKDSGSSAPSSTDAKPTNPQAQNPPPPAPEPVNNVPPITKEELDALTKSASTDNIFAIRRLGEAYFHGNGVKADRDKAHGYFKQGAELNDAASMYYLGLYYEIGIGEVKRNMTEAIDLYKKSAAKNYQPAMEKLMKLRQY